MSAGWVEVACGSQILRLPVTSVANDVQIALLMTIDVGISTIDLAGEELAALLAPSRPEVIATAATLGIPVAIAVARALGLDDYVVLQKSRKWHLRSSPSTVVTSITTENSQSLTLDERRVPHIAGARVAFVDDVISTGGSARAAVDLLADNGAHIVSIGALMTEGTDWKERLGERAMLVHALGELPTSF